MLYIETWNFPGRLNMALDVVLGEFSFEVGSPVLRIYSWERPTLSIGRNQEFHLEVEGMDCVRRPSGGRAVLHWKEITYSVSFPKGSEEHGLSVLELYKRIASMFSSALESLGFPVELSKGWGSLKNASCFSSSARYELMIHGKKFMGSAQFRTSKYVVQHGSIILEYPSVLIERIFGRKDEKAVGILEVSKVPFRKIVDSIVEVFDRSYGLRSVPFSKILDLISLSRKREVDFVCRNYTSSRRP